jgi:hypothetical protein
VAVPRPSGRLAAAIIAIVAVPVLVGEATTTTESELAKPLEAS